MNSIAILIPCYNAAEYLSDLFEGINAQTIPFDEIICYDDCSTDNTIEVALRLGAKVIKGYENKGPSFGRNRLIEATKSDWIHFHDADDLIDPSFVEVFQKYIIDQNTQFLCNAAVLYRLNRSINVGNIVYDSLNEADDQLEYFLNNVGFASMGLYSRKALKSIGGFREDLKANEDPDLHVRLVKNGFTIKAIKKYLVTKLEHDTSYSHQNWMLCIESKLICYESYFNTFEKKYFKIIGKQLAICGAYFYTHKNIVAGAKTFELVKKTGIRSIDSSRFSFLFTKIFGIKAYYKLLRIRNNSR